MPVFSDDYAQWSVMSVIRPQSVEELSATLQEASAKQQPIGLRGRGSKYAMGGPATLTEVVLSTSELKKVRQYEPRDLTISVEAGLPWMELQALLAKNGQMIALDPPFGDRGTVGGVIATNSSGPIRRLYGTARDLVIGMSFVTLQGRTVQTGGMVVKNVAGLDMAKLMIGSFGTLGVITSINFKVSALPAKTRTFLRSFASVDTAFEERNRILNSVLQPFSIDLLNPAAAAASGYKGYLLAIQVGGSDKVLQRYSQELTSSEAIEGEPERQFWNRIVNFTPDFLAKSPAGIVLKIATTLYEMADVASAVSVPLLCRAGSGVSYCYLDSWQDAEKIMKSVRERGWQVHVEFAPDEVKETKELWPLPESSASLESFAMMKKVKQMFDPNHLLNRGRLYGRI